MPMRDHFPAAGKSTWEAVHGGWPMVIVQHLNPILPPNYVAEPRVHLGSAFEIDIATFEQNSEDPWLDTQPNSGGTALATYAPAKPTVAFPTLLSAVTEYEVLLFDREFGNELVAAIELVSPSNKDRPETRKAFALKCATMLRQGVCVTIIDLISIRRFNLYDELLSLIDQPKPVNGKISPSTYAVSCRVRETQTKPQFEAWPHVLSVGTVLPELPIWLNEDLALPLNLEASYQETCKTLRIK